MVIRLKKKNMSLRCLSILSILGPGMYFSPVGIHKGNTVSWHGIILTATSLRVSILLSLLGQADVKIPHKVCLWKHKQQGYEAKQTLCAEPSAAIGLGHCQKPWDHVAALGLTNRGSLGKAPCGLYFSSLVKGVNLSQCCLLPGLWNNLTQMFWAQMKLVVSICWFTLWAKICGSGH